MTHAEPTLEEFRAEARRWLASVTEPKPDGEVVWGDGDDSVVIFDNLSDAEEAALVKAGREWERLRFEAGFGAITWPADIGGRGLAQRYAEAYDRVESTFVTPRRNELFEVTRSMVAPTIDVWGTPEQKQRFVVPLLRADLLCCQLFSEPGAGSDLAAVSTKAVRDGEAWVLDGQKVWTSGASRAEWGLAICRTDPSVAKHAGMTAFMVPMDAAGVSIRPIKQMSGGASFNEVFLDGVRIGDELRIGPVGAGWKVALTTLATERSASGSLGGGTFEQVLALARAVGLSDHPLHRQRIADLWMHRKLEALNTERVSQSLEAGELPGPEGSIGRLVATRNLTRMADVVSGLLGARLTADTGEWGTYAWADHVLGAPGYRIAGGSDEIQHSIIGERVLGLPREPR